MSFAVRQDSEIGTPARKIPLWSLTIPPAVTRQRTSSVTTDSTRSRIMPSSIQISSPGLAARR